MAKRNGRPSHKPTPELRERALKYARCGVPHHDMSRLMGISTPTLLKHYGEELAQGKAEANAEASGRLFALVKKDNLGAIVFWLKAQAGWRETQRTELANPPGEVLRTKGEVGPDKAMQTYLQMLASK